ncbi:MAG: DUF5602 domain-containing protein [Bryobacteraceae bacterium]|nr:DUF5602 domain-containing protein [Bryobacteraceae bacterium]
MKLCKWLVGLLSIPFLLSPALQTSLRAQGPTVTVVGEEKAIGNGKVRTWLKIDAKTREPRVLGVTLTEAALAGLPGEKDPAQAGSVKLKLMDGGPDHTFEYELMFPKDAAETAFNHMGFNWNPVGHGPKGVFTKGHFDVHFYMSTPEYRHHIEVDTQDADPIHLKTSNLEQPSQFLPPDYQLAPNTAEPRMGSHYADVTSPQLKPGGFSNIFLIGAHGGNILFWEPMITREYLLTKPRFSQKLKLPESYPVSGYYPTAYSVTYDATRKEYDISLDGLTFRLSGYPKNVYGVEPCIDSRVAQMMAKYKKVPDIAATKNCVSLVQSAISK